MKILVTGGAGYKGCVLSDQLLDAQHEVTVVDNLRWGAWPVMHLLPRPGYRLVKGDVRDSNLMAQLVRGVDAVINLAGIVGHPECDKFPNDALQINVQAVENILSLLKPSQMFVQASTGSVYGKLEEICTEQSPTVPLSLYGQTKLKAEDFVRRFGGVSLRFATAFGVSPCMRFDVVPSFFTWKALTERCMVVYEGHARRTLIDVWDMGRSYIHALKNYDKMQYHVYNVGDVRLNVTKRAVVEEIQKVIKEKEGWDVPIFGDSSMKDKDARDYEVDYTKFRDTGFECQVMLREGLLQTYEAAKVVIGSNPNPWRLS